MKKSFIFTFMLFVSSLYASVWELDVKFNKPAAMYLPGEKIVVSVQMLKNGKAVEGKNISWLRKGDDGKNESGKLVSQLKPVEILTALNRPGFVYLRITGIDDKGKALAIFNGGAGVQPEKIKSISEPIDFDDFWTSNRNELSKVPMKSVLTPIKTKNPDLVGFDVRVVCAGGKPVSGYLFKPKKANSGSLPAVVRFHGYGVSGASDDETYAANGMISFDINAHGIPNGQNREYYSKLRNTELKAYGFRGNHSRDSSYFKGMLLRVMRALEFVKSQPEWDGKNLIVTGGSQGGFMAIAAAGLDEHVTLCKANKPWLCDLGGCTLGRFSGWRPKYMPALGYFDPANLAKRIKCPTVVYIGLGDTICPPSGVSAMYNNIKASKKIFYIQGATHKYMPPEWTNCSKKIVENINRKKN